MKLEDSCPGCGEIYMGYASGFLSNKQVDDTVKQYKEWVKVHSHSSTPNTQVVGVEQKRKPGRPKKAAA